MINVDSTKNIQVLSLCSGSLGIERGIERSIGKVRTVCYVEREAFPIFNLVAAMEAGLVDTAPIWTDVTTFDGKPFHNRIHLITGGYPCQGESSAGLRLLEKDPRYLWPHFRRIIQETNPICCFFENVGSHLSGTFKYVLRDLRDMGFSVEAGLYSASEVGAPHIRERVFILACTNFGFLRKLLAYAGSESRYLSEKPRRENEVATTGRSEILATANGLGIGKSLCIRQPKQSNEIQFTWPARPGEPQHEWEEPRTIPTGKGKGKAKSGLGCTVNGYDFRTDLLRMYGNAVVEQTAELAFTELSKKHLKNCK